MTDALSSVRQQGRCNRAMLVCWLLRLSAGSGGSCSRHPQSHVCCLSGNRCRFKALWGCCWCSANNPSCQNTAAVNALMVRQRKHLRASQCWSLPSQGKRCACFCSAESGRDRCYSPALRSNWVTPWLVCFCCGNSRGALEAKCIWLNFVVLPKTFREQAFISGKTIYAAAPKIWSAYSVRAYVTIKRFLTTGRTLGCP